jgi:beta-lactam-binding protein with PASTA domain
MKGRLIALSLIALAGVAASSTLAGPSAGEAAVAKTRVPDLTNVRVELAVERLTGAGLCVGRVKMHPVLGKGKGDVVVGQSPKAGKALDRLRQVNVDVAVSTRAAPFTYATPPGCPLPS